MVNIPVINIDALFPGGNPEARLQTAQAIGNAARDVGFFVITGHRVKDSVIEDAWYVFPLLLLSQSSCFCFLFSFLSLFFRISLAHALCTLSIPTSTSPSIILLTSIFLSSLHSRLPNPKDFHEAVLRPVGG